LNDVLYEKAEQLYEREDYKGALSLFRALNEEEYSNDCQNYIGCCYLQMENWQEAISVFNQLRESEPNWSRPVFNLGRVYYAMGDREAAFDLFDLAVFMNPYYCEDAYYYRGMYYQNSKQYDLAIEDYKFSLKIDFFQPETHLNLGCCYDAKGMTKEALEEYYIASEQDPKDANALFNIGMIQKENGQTLKALEAFLSCNELAPDDTGCLKEIVNCYYRLKDYSLAKVWNEKILALCPTDEQALVVHEKNY